MNRRKYIFWPDWKLVLTNIDGTTASKFCQNHRRTYAHIHHIVHALAEEGLLTLKKEGRQNIVSLTDRGREIVTNFRNIDRIMKAESEDEANGNEDTDNSE